MSRRISLSLRSGAPGARSYASAVLRNSSGYQVPHPLTGNSRTPVYRSRPDLPTSPRPPSPFYLCTDPSSPPQFDHSLFLGCGDMKRAFKDGVEMLVKVKPSFVFSPKFSRILQKNGIVVPSRNLYPFNKAERAKTPEQEESECSALSSSTLSSDISQWTEIKDPFARERGDTHTSDIDSAGFSRSPSLLTLYTDSTVEYNESSFVGSHSSDLVPVLSPCIRFSFLPVRSGFSPVASGVSPSPVRSVLPAFSARSVFPSSPSLVRSGLCSSPSLVASVSCSPLPWASVSCSSSPVALAFPSSPSPVASVSCSSPSPVRSGSLPVAPPPSPVRSVLPVVSSVSSGLLATSVSSVRRHYRRFYNPRFDPQNPLFEPHLLPGPAATRSLPPVLDQDDNSLLELDLDSTLDSNPYSSYPVPGEWPDSDSGLEPTSGPVGWLKAMTSPAVALVGVAVAAGLCAAQFLPWAPNNALPSRGVGRQYPGESLGKPTEQTTSSQMKDLFESRTEIDA